MQEESFGLHRSCRSIFARGDRFRPGRKMQKIFQSKTCNFRSGWPGFAWSEKEGCSLEHFRPGRQSFAWNEKEDCSLEHFRPGRQIFARAKDHLLGLPCHFRPGREFSPGRKFRALVFKYLRVPSEGLASLLLQPSLRRHPPSSWISCLNLHFSPFISF